MIIGLCYRIANTIALVVSSLGSYYLLQHISIFFRFFKPIRQRMPQVKTYIFIIAQLSIRAITLSSNFFIEIIKRLRSVFFWNASNKRVFSRSLIEMSKYTKDRYAMYCSDVDM